MKNQVRTSIQAALAVLAGLKCRDCGRELGPDEKASFGRCPECDDRVLDEIVDEALRVDREMYESGDPRSTYFDKDES